MGSKAQPNLVVITYINGGEWGTHTHDGVIAGNNQTLETLPPPSHPSPLVPHFPLVACIGNTTNLSSSSRPPCYPLRGLGAHNGEVGVFKPSDWPFAIHRVMWVG